jgi:hypothetical protein
MKATFSEIIGHCHSDLLKDIVRTGLGYNKESFKKIVKHIPRNLRLQGFREIRELTFQHHMKLFQLFLDNKLYIIPEISKAILKIWLTQNTELNEGVFEYLKKNGYTPKVPDFKEDCFCFCVVDRNHLIKKSAGAYLQKPPTGFEGIPDEDFTFMAALLGVSVVELEQLEESENEILESAESIPKEFSMEQRFENLLKEAEETGDAFKAYGKNLSKGFIAGLNELIERYDRFEDSFIQLNQEVAEEIEILSINELIDYYNTKKIDEQDNALKLLSTILTKIRSIKVSQLGDDKFLSELNTYADDVENTVSDSSGGSKEILNEINSDKNIFNHIINAITIRSEPEPNYTELDSIIAIIENFGNEAQLSFIDKLVTELNRGHLLINMELDNPTVQSPPEGEAIDSNGIHPSSVEIINSEDIVVEVVKSHESDGVIPSVISHRVKNTNPPKSETIDEASITNKAEMKADLAEGDNNVLQLIVKERYGLAFHLTKCYSESGMQTIVPPPILRNFLLAQDLRNPSSRMADEIRLNLEQYDLVGPNSNMSQEYNLIIVSTILRPALLAGHTTGAAGVLIGIQIDDYPQLTELKRFLFEFIRQSGKSVDYNFIRNRINEKKVDEVKLAALSLIRDWYGGAQNYKFRSKGEVFSRAWSRWFQKGGYFTKPLNAFLKEPLLKQAMDIKNLLEESNWKESLYRDLNTVFNLKKSRIHGQGVLWFQKQIRELEVLVENYLELVNDEHLGLSSGAKGELDSFLNGLENKVKNSSLEVINNKPSISILQTVAMKMVFKSLQNIRLLLSGDEESEYPRPINIVQNSCLMELDYYESDYNWNPTNTDLLINQIEKEINKEKEETKEILSRHLFNGNFEALERLMSSGKIVLNDICKPKEYIDKKEELKARLLHEGNQIKTLVEKGCFYGYVSDSNRLVINGKIDALINLWESRQEGINYPLASNALIRIKEDIENERVSQTGFLSKKIQPSWGTEILEILNQLLSEGKVLLFNEYLHRIEKGEDLSQPSSPNEFEEFYSVFLTAAPKVQGLTVKRVGNIIKEKKDLLAVNYGSLPATIREKSLTMITVWEELGRSIDTRQNRSEIDDLIFQMILNLGLKNPKISNSKTLRRGYYCDINADVMSGRTKSPIPSYGSIAGGKYRFICILDGPAEDELVDEVKELTPKTGRAVIVFYFNKMKQQRRKDLARHSKANKCTFVLLDQYLLIYLLGLRESLFPVFLKLALPFTYSQPYQTDSSNLPEEMFYGRSNDLEALMSRVGNVSCFIYGGRQLGKTVLLREASRKFHSPQEGAYSIYLELKSHGIGSFLDINILPQFIGQKLIEILPDFNPRVNKIKTETLRIKIREWLHKNTESRILLFLDEADNFLEADAKADFPISASLKGLMEETDKRFKVVFAGLHNVRRTTKISNHPLAHFGNPICVGPLNNSTDAIEAEKLIRVPLESLGFRFENEDSVFLILNHTNWYPSLIQIFCNKLLTIMYNEKFVQGFPVLIGEDKISEALVKSKEQIKEKFRLTLGLDERYDLIANIIAYEIMEDSSLLTDGLSLNQITSQAIGWWPKGFEAAANPKETVFNLISEMVELGVLRQTTNGYYSIRESNLVDLIGTKEEVDFNISKKRDLPSQFKPEIHHVSYEVDGHHKLSPFTAQQYYSIFDIQRQTTIIMGSFASGLNSVSIFLNHREDVKLHHASEIFDLTGFVDYSNSVKVNRDKDKYNIILVKSQVPYNFEWILRASEWIKSLSNICIVFLMEPDMINRLTSDPAGRINQLVNMDINLIRLPRMHENAIKEWFKEAGLINIANNMSDVLSFTGRWFNNIEKFQSEMFSDSTNWERIIQKLFPIPGSVEEVKVVIGEFGILEAQEIQFLTNLIEIDGNLEEEELVEYLSDSYNEQFINIKIDKLTFLNILDNELKVDNYIKRLFKSVD